ncbi:glycosyltransferase family 2 protein [Paenibacillus sp. N3/727]|uniref:glycosyltransferase family 2 protein n=1 Tax=Paenibacillus sp. N3/727 TaxID=2925845 RepID=UPI001F53E0DE|nr:glycosyltransferase family 2 protein [Paenibacillus sp. N3/727]UNK18012.1 glycosyltransferase family 2 protein [Paenibacillus sp. N3/727]
MKKVQVLLSAYNGERYISEQIESIMKQSYPDVSVLVRDDGSSDGTIHIVQKLMKFYPGRIQMITGSNIGVIGSFFELLIHSDSEADFYCFCDQDDVWFDYKVKSAVSHLDTISHVGKPAMVFTSTLLTDEKLNSRGTWPQSPSRKPSFYNALVQNIAVGATITFNKDSRNFFLENHQPDRSKVLMHDWWFYILVSAFGTVVYEEKPSMMYRQHGNNFVGGSNSLIQKLRNKFNSFRKHFGKHLLFHQALEFERVYGMKLSPEKKEQLDLFLQARPRLIDRIRYLSQSKLYRQSLVENILFKFLVLVNYI